MSQPHFVRDYNKLVHQLVAREPNYELAMALAVGADLDNDIGSRQRRILESLGLQDTHYVIDVGVGSGRTPIALRDMPKLRYLGTDVVPELLEFAREKCGRPDWEFKIVNTLEIPEQDGVADFVVFFSVFTHLTEKEGYRYLQEARRVLKKSGTIVISYLDPDIEAQARMAHPSLGMLGKNISNQLLRWRHHCRRIIGDPGPLNQLLSRKVLDSWAKSLDLSIAYVDAGHHIGQSICAYRLASSRSV